MGPLYPTQQYFSMIWYGPCNLLRPMKPIDAEELPAGMGEVSGIKTFSDKDYPVNIRTDSAQVLFCGAAEYAPLLREAANLAGLTIDVAPSAADLLARLKSGGYSVTVVQHGIPDLDPVEFMECARKLTNPAMPVFLLPVSMPTSEAVQLVKMGA